jgi:modulator of FtsH protease
MNNPRYSGYQGYPQGGAAVASAPALLGQVLGITGVGFLITAIGAYLFRGVSPQVGMIAMFVGLGMIFFMQAASRGNPRTALLWFYAFTLVEGIGIAPIISQYAQIDGGAVVFNAAATTGFGMLVLGGVAFTFSVDWRRFQGVAFGLLIALIVIGIASAFLHFLQPGVYAWATLGIFTLITLVDFSRIRAGGGGANAVQLAVAIYLDALNIFIALLQLFGMRAGSRDD